MKIQALIFDGFDELDIIGAFEPLRMAGVEVLLVSLYQQPFVTAIHGARFLPDHILDLNNKPDILLVPGGGWIFNANVGAKVEANKGFILTQLFDLHAAGVTLAAVCTGALLLGKAGLLKGRPATTNHAAVDELKLCGATFIDARVADDGDIVTAAGITSSLDLGLWLVERYVSKHTAQDVCTRLEYERIGQIWTKQSGYGASGVASDRRL